MNFQTETNRGLILAVTCLVALAWACGCLPSRPEYFGRVHDRRLDSFRRWENDARDNDRDKPSLSGELNLEETIRLTLSCNTQIQAMLQEKRKAEGRVMSAYAEAMPKVDATGNYTRLDKIQTIDLPGGSFPVGAKDNYSYRVEISQPLFKGGSMIIAQRAARLFSYLSDEKIRQEAERALYQVTKAYFKARLAGHLINVQKAALQAARKHLKDVRARQEHGTATEFDVLRARVDVSNVRADLIKQRNQRDQATTRLFRIMGVSQRSNVELVTKMNYQPIQPDFARSVQQAFDRRPDIYRAELNVALQTEKLRDTYSRYWPNISAYFWKEWAKPNPHDATDINWDSQYQGGIQLTWPIFDGLAREGSIIQDRATLRQNRILLDDTEELAIQEVRDAILELQNARQLVESQQLNLKRADRALDLVQAGYKEGVNTEVEVLDARAALTEARGLYFQALHRHIQARIDLQKAKGILGPPPGTHETPADAVDSQDVLRKITGEGAASEMDSPTSQK